MAPGSPPAPGAGATEAATDRRLRGPRRRHGCSSDGSLSGSRLACRADMSVCEQPASTRGRAVLPRAAWLRPDTGPCSC